MNAYASFLTSDLCSSDLSSLVNNSLRRIASPAADQRHDFDLIVGLQHASGMLCARDEREIPFDRQIARLLVQSLQQQRHGRIGRHVERFSVHPNLHNRMPRKVPREPTSRSLEVPPESVKQRTE